MRNSIGMRWVLAIMILSGLGWTEVSVRADEDTGWTNYDDYVVIDHDTTWQGTLTRADLAKPVVIVNNATLTIEAGTHVAMDRIMVYDGRILARGMATDRIVFTKQEPDLSVIPEGWRDEYDPECFPDAFPSGTIEFSENVESDDVSEDSVFRFVDFDHLGRQISDAGKHCPSQVGMGRTFRDVFSIGTAEASRVRTFRDPALHLTNGRVKIEYSAFIGSAAAAIEAELSFGDDWTSYDLLSVTQSDFEGSGDRIAVETHFSFPEGHWASEYSEHVRLTDNWYGHADGPSYGPFFSSPGERLLGDATFIGWKKTPFRCIDECPSNVLLLPGIKLSRLYTGGAHGTEDQLWPPNYFGDDLEDLELDADGKSIKPVYIKEGDVLSDVGASDIYTSFLDRLEELKSTGTINEYESFAYDWRGNVEEVARSGSPGEHGQLRSAVETALALAASSRSGKVTIVAHSNGGLLAKAILMELERQGLADRVDTVAMVGTPQMGTPIAMLSLLYGYDESVLFGTLIARDEARKLAEHMPGAYGLLPSREYLERTREPLVTFDATRTRYRAFTDAYGESIGDISELGRFLAGQDDHRDKPDADDVERENVLSPSLLAEAREMHERLDHWSPPSGVRVIQIAGWGIDTVSGVKYTEKSLERCYYSGSSLPSCVDEGKYEEIYEPTFTVDGDEVVTAPSALMMPETKNVKRYWVDLFEANKKELVGKLSHKNLFEINSVNTLLSRLITHENGELPNFLKDSRPDDFVGAASRIRLSLYSPLDVHLYDAEGNHTGPTQEIVDGHTVTVFEEGIPNSSYLGLGERKYLSFSSGEPIRIELAGYALGSYTLKLAEVRPTATGEETLFETVFADLPTIDTARVRLDIPAGGLEDLPALRADLEGDGTDDYTVEPVIGGTATLEPTDTAPPVTMLELAGTQGHNGWYTSAVAVTLSAQDEAGGSGIGRTEYSFDQGATWIAYDRPFTITNEGKTVLQYRSFDQAGNQEAIRATDIRIDQASPEVKIVLNAETRKLDIRGQDAADDALAPAVLATTETRITLEPWQILLSRVFHMTWPTKKTMLTATISDAAGHTTTLTFDRVEDRKNRIGLTLRSIVSDSLSTAPVSTIQYQWRVDRDQRFTRLAASLHTPRDFVETHYLPAQDITRVMRFARDLTDDESDADIGRRPVRQKLPGRVIPGILTEQGKVKIVY